MNNPRHPPTSINLACYPTEFQQVILEKSLDFIGRNFVFTAVNDFLHCQNRGYFTIVGTPGSGKSAIMAKYVIDNPGVIYYNLQSIGKNRSEEFFRSICAQIAETFAVDILHTTSISGILQQVSNQLGLHQRLIIVLDGLDTINRKSQPPGSNLFYLPRYLPEKVYFLLTRRPFLKGKSGLLVETPSRILDLNKYTEENRRDMQIYIQRELLSENNTLTNKNYISKKSIKNISGESLKEIISSLADVSENNFIYLSQILPVIAEEFYSNAFQFVDTLHLHNKLPPNLKKYYETLWQKMVVEQSTDLALDVLRVLISSVRLREGVSVEYIAQIINADEFDVEEVLQMWVEFLQHKEIGGENYYRLFHSSFCIWLEQNI